MELQFDKEMDAILRKARDNRGVLVGDAPPEPKKHLDADTIAAFAENAVPPKAKLLYMEHFADCDRCRRMLSNSILLNAEAVAVTDRAASSAVAESIGSAVPWYLKIFRTPNLAIAMGALVLALGGVMVYLVLQNRSDGNSASVAKVTEKDQNHGTFSASEPAANTAAAANSANVSAANSVANLSAAPNAPASNPIPSASGPSAVEEPDLARRADAPGSSGTGSSDSPAKTAGAPPEDAKATSVAPPPVPAQPLLDRDERKAGEDKEKQKDDSRERVMSKSGVTTTDADNRDGLSNAKKSGPNRASGPRNAQQNVQQEINNQVAAGMIAPPTRSAGGKKFENRDGAWYDTAYHGQATSDYRRGTDEYKKLDGGLRKIADSVGGTVVVVWKSKAYRIQ